MHFIKILFSPLLFIFLLMPSGSAAGNSLALFPPKPLNAPKQVGPSARQPSTLSLPPPSRHHIATTSAYIPGEVLVKYRDGVSSLGTASLNKSLGATKARNLGRTGIQQVKVRPGLSVEEAITEFHYQPEVEFAQPNYIYHHFATTPNDPSYPNLWSLDNRGQTVNSITGTADADIDAPEAWEINRGSPPVIVAVIDSGVDYNHPDISSNIWTNPGENATNNIDDDGNGYIDDSRGWDFVDNDNNPMGVNSHGTHVAGTIGAVGNNSLGVTGVSWTVKIIPIRVLDSLGAGTTANITAGIDYAVANRARIINMSIGSNPGGSADPTLIAAIADADRAGVLLVIAAGNSANNNDSFHVYPSDYPDANIISVAATDQNDALASFSNYGSVSVDVGAPGTNIYSLMAAREIVYSEDFEGTTGGWTFSTTAGNSWAFSPATAYSGSKSLDDGSGAANYPDNNNASATSASFSLAGKSGCLLDFWFAYDTEPNYDLAYVQISTGGPYSNLPGTPYSGRSYAGYWYKKTFDMKPYEGNAAVSLRFTLTSNNTTTYEGVHVDDIVVTCSSTTFSGSEYYYNQGTSMAAPHVAGLAALILAQDSSIGVTRLKALILDNGDSAPALTGKTTTGKRINAAKSLLAIDNIAPIPLGTGTGFVINAGAADTTSTGVSLTLGATDNLGVTGYYASETPTTPILDIFTAIAPTTYYVGTVPFTLSTGEGIKTVYVWYRDAWGNISSVVADAINYYTPLPPAGGGGGGCAINPNQTGFDPWLIIAIIMLKGLSLVFRRKKHRFPGE